MATFLAGDKAAPVFGVILIGDGADEGSTAVIYILADSAEEAAKLAQSTAASMERA